MVHRIFFAFILFSMLLTGGCGLTSKVTTPAANVESVKVVDQSDHGARIELIVRLVNSNDFALPLKRVNYRVEVEGIGSFSFRDDPNRTLPGVKHVKAGTVAMQRLHLYAGIKTRVKDFGGKRYKASGTITYVPPGEIRKLFTDSRIPLPVTSFIGSGTLE